MSVLLIVAAGMSSRFGGTPKFAAEIGDKTVIENTIDLCRKHVSHICVALNTKTVVEYEDLIKKNYGAEVLTIECFASENHYGDLYAIYESLRQIHHMYPEEAEAYVVWGDATLLSDDPLVSLIKFPVNNAVAVSMDEHPYAWFDVDELNDVRGAKFKKECGDIPEGMHDQSFFKFNIVEFLYFVKMYFETQNFRYGEYREKKDELKTLNFISWLYDNGSRVKALIIPGGNVLAFNTIDELDEIRSCIAKQNEL